MSEYGSGIAYSPYEDFDPTDPNEVEIVGMATGLDRLNYTRRQFERLGDIESHDNLPKVKLTSDEGETKWLSVPPAAVAEIRAILERAEADEED